MSLYETSGLSVDDLARRLNLESTDDTAGLTMALESACSDIEPYVLVYDVTPAGLKMAILDTAATRYDRTHLTTKETLGGASEDYSDEYAQLFQRIAPYRFFAGT
jgi:hypothetical protein